MQDTSPPKPSPCPHTRPGAAEIRETLERILGDPGFQASERRRAFLRHVVEETLAGRADRLKGYSIALAVFDRDDSFDAQADPIVRIEARRLRRDLDSYYSNAGARDPLRIAIPKGAYVPSFEWSETAVTAPPPELPGARVPPDPQQHRDTGARGRLIRTGAVVACIFGIIVAGWFAVQHQMASREVAAGDPTVVVMPFEALGSSAEVGFLARGMTQVLIEDLMRFPGLRLYSRPHATTGGTGVQAAADRLDPSYIVRGTLREEGASIHLTTQIEDARTGEVLWSGRDSRPFRPEALIAIQDDLTGKIAAALGEPYGVINDDLRRRVADAGVSDMQSYVCVLRAFAYRRDFAADDFGPVTACLEQAVQRDPGYVNAWAMLGWMQMDAGRFGFVPAGQRHEAYAAGLDAASHAVGLDPNNALAVIALSSINHYMGHYDTAETLARRALELNPHDPETLAQLGWRLAVRGKFDQGIPFLKRAISRSMNPPGWYYHLIAIDLMMNGDFEPMLDVALTSAGDGSLVSQALIAIAAGALCRPEVAEPALRRIAAAPAFNADPGAYVRLHGATEEIVAAFERGLDNARRGDCATGAAD